MNDIKRSSGWQDGELIIIPYYCAILELKQDKDFIPIYVYIKTIKAHNCPYDLSIGKDVKELMETTEGRIPVRCLLHNNDLIIINANKNV